MRADCPRAFVRVFSARLRPGKHYIFIDFIRTDVNTILDYGKWYRLPKQEPCAVRRVSPMHEIAHHPPSALRHKRTERSIALARPLTAQRMHNQTHRYTSVCAAGHSAAAVVLFTTRRIRDPPRRVRHPARARSLAPIHGTCALPECLADATSLSIRTSKGAARGRRSSLGM